METAWQVTACQVAYSASPATPFVVQAARSLTETVAGISCLVLAANASGSWVKLVQVEVAIAFLVGPPALVVSLMERISREGQSGTASPVPEAAQVTAFQGTVSHVELHVMVAAAASQGIACQVEEAVRQGLLLSHGPFETWVQRSDPAIDHLGKPAAELTTAEAQVAGEAPLEQHQLQHVVHQQAAS